MSIFAAKARADSDYEFDDLFGVFRMQSECIERKKSGNFLPLQLFCHNTTYSILTIHQSKRSDKNETQRAVSHADWFARDSIRILDAK
jgi:hypothetical protein